MYFVFVGEAAEERLMLCEQCGGEGWGGTWGSDLSITEIGETLHLSG